MLQGSFVPDSKTKPAVPATKNSPRGSERKGIRDAATSAVVQLRSEASSFGGKRGGGNSLLFRGLRWSAAEIHYVHTASKGL